jgi:type I restriction enzyme S subunit
MVITAQDTKLKPGYKQTEVGVIPKDWIVKTLGEIVDKERPISYGIVQTGKSVDNGVSCVRVVDLDNGKIKKENLITTSTDISNSYRRTILKEGDLVIALRGKIGELAVVGKELTGSNLTRGVALIAVNNSLDALFFLQQLSSFNSKKIFEKNLNGSALQEIPINVLRKIPVAYPPTKHEQAAIAAVLSDVDTLIASLDKLIAKKRDIKQATMQLLLTGKIRLLGFSGELKPTYKQTEIGVIPEDWKLKTFRVVCRVNQGLQIAIENRLKNPTEKSKIYITIQYLNDGKEVEYIDNYTFSVCCDKDDILMTRTGNTGFVVSGVSGVFHNNFFKARFKRT